MTLSSMTGFARTEGELPGARFVCEVRSLNGRGLDLRCRLPQGLEGLESAVRTLVAERFTRGSLQVALTLTARVRPVELRLNEVALDQVLRIARSLEGTPGVAPARLDGLLLLKGVLEAAEPEESEAERAAREASLLRAIADTLDRLRQARRNEGHALVVLLDGQLRRIGELTQAARSLNALAPAGLKAKLERDLAALGTGVPSLPPDRLAQEIALLAAKADATEELDRLDAHVAQARTLLGSPEPIGRKLDFLSQELNREANTLCSKSSAIELTRIGLDLKTLIDQFREQIQNVE